MRNLASPSRDSARTDLETALQTYRYAGEERGYAASKQEIDQVIEIYDRYDHEQGAPLDQFKGAHLTEGLRDAVLKAYDLTYFDRKLDHLRKALFADVSLCPTCGIDPPTEIDHFLPSSVFKPLSIYPRNLVPLCHRCNHIKLDVVEGGPDQRFLNAYLNPLPDADFFVAEVRLLGEALDVNFKIVEHADLTDQMRTRLSFQLTKLKLNERYRAELNAYMSSHTTAMYMCHLAGGPEHLRFFLNIQARQEKNSFYRSHWRPTLLKGLAQCDEFCNGGFRDVFPVAADIMADLLGAAAA